MLCQIVKADVFPNWQEVRRENALVEIQTLVYPKCPNPKPYNNKKKKVINIAWTKRNLL